MQAFLKLHRADIAQRLVNSAVVVERHPVSHLVHGLPASLVFPALQTAHFQAPPEILCGCVAPEVASRLIELLSGNQPVLTGTHARIIGRIQPVVVTPLTKEMFMGRPASSIQVDGERSDAFAERAVASARSGATVLGADCDRDCDLDYEPEAD